MNEDRKSLALEYLNAVGKHEYDTVEALVAPDLQFLTDTPEGAVPTIEWLRFEGERSALHRARATVAGAPRDGSADPPPEVLAAYVRAWETRDIDSLVALLRKDVVFAMPPHATWFRGAEAVRTFLETPRFGAFWTRGFLRRTAVQPFLLVHPHILPGQDLRALLRRR